MTTTIAELKLQAKRLGLKGFTKLRKEELEHQINKAKREKARKTVPVPTTLEETHRTLGLLTKGNARKMRKLLRRKGRNQLAAAERKVV